MRDWLIGLQDFVRSPALPALLAALRAIVDSLAWPALLCQGVRCGDLLEPNPPPSNPNEPIEGPTLAHVEKMPGLPALQDSPIVEATPALLDSSPWPAMQDSPPYVEATPALACHDVEDDTEGESLGPKTARVGPVPVGKR